MHASKLIDILYQDESIIVTGKKSGISVIPERNLAKPSVINYLKQHLHLETIIPVHRIDKDTSGICVFAKHEMAHKTLNKQFQERTVQKTYQAIIKGIPSEQGTIDRPIATSGSSNKMIIHKDGKHSISHYKRMDQSTQFSLLEVEIETGRTHQIRVHLAALGFPILGDALYNMHPYHYISTYKRNYNSSNKKSERPVIERTALHAWKLAFEHPQSNIKVDFKMDPPKDFSVCWKLLRKYA